MNLASIKAKNTNLKSLVQGLPHAINLPHLPSIKRSLRKSGRSSVRTSVTSLLGSAPGDGQTHDNFALRFSHKEVTLPDLLALPPQVCQQEWLANHLHSLTENLNLIHAVVKTSCDLSHNNLVNNRLAQPSSTWIGSKRRRESDTVLAEIYSASHRQMQGKETRFTRSQSVTQAAGPSASDLFDSAFTYTYDAGNRSKDDHFLDDPAPLGQTCKRVPESFLVARYLAEANSLLRNPAYFPTKYGVAFPEDFRRICKYVYKMLYRVFEHVYYKHFGELRGFAVLAASVVAPPHRPSRAQAPRGPHGSQGLPEICLGQAILLPG